MEKECAVSVLCTTYNQRNYIKKALDSILMQKTTFPFEIIVHDDASTDGTTDIVRAYQNHYPDRITAIVERENQYSKGCKFCEDILRNVAVGKYLAICEGDDYWTDNKKLQIQWEMMEQHPECDMCACRGSIVTEDGEREISQIRPRTEDGILPIEDVILGGGLYLATAGLFYKRKSFIDHDYSIALDYFVQMEGALKGGIIYSDRKMVAYRRYSKGSWTNTVLKNKDRLKKQWKVETDFLRKFDEETEGKYHETIMRRLKSYIPFVDQLAEHDEEICSIMKSLRHPIYIWGRGRRGTDLEEYFQRKKFDIEGICDAINKDIGSKTEFENEILSTEYVINNAGSIIASNQYAFNDLLRKSINCKIINFQQFMPWG